MGTRLVDQAGRFIDYRLNILGVRVWENECGLIARRSNTWFPIGQNAKLPIAIPRNMDELKKRLDDEICVTACQFYIESPQSDIVEVLGKRKDFSAALGEAAVA